MMMTDRVPGGPDGIRHEVDTAFDMLRNNRGQLLLAIETREGEPQEPKLFVYGQAAYPVLRRAADYEIGLPDMDDATLAWLAQAKSILVIEMTGGELSRSYEAAVVV
jgi:hypothetical protein